MKRWLLVGVMMAGWLGLPDCVRAQYGPYARPQYGPFQGAPGVSPYLNLALGTNIAGVTPGLNFLALTIPAFNQRAVNSVVGNDLNYLSRAIGQTASPAVPDGLFTPLPQTGHPVGFNTVGSYYNFNPAAVRGGGSGYRTLPGTPRQGTIGTSP